MAYGEKVIFQGPLPEKMELLADKGLLNLMYSQEIQVQRQDKIFEVRIVETTGVRPVLGVRIFSTLKPISLIVTFLWAELGFFWQGGVYPRGVTE